MLRIAASKNGSRLDKDPIIGKLRELLGAPIMKDSIEVRVKKLEENNRLLTENLFDAIWVIDAASMTFKYVTPSIERISGYTAEEYLGKPLKERMSEQTYDEIRKAIDKTMGRLHKGIDTIQAFEVELKHKNGGLYWVEVRAKLLSDKDGSIQIVGVSRDITQRKKYEFSQEELIQSLNTALAEKHRLAEENKMLRKIIPICSGCKRIRDENNKWWPLDYYVERHTGSSMSHTICPDCRAVMYNGL